MRSSCWVMCLSMLSVGAGAEVIFPAVDCVIVPSVSANIGSAVPGVIERIHVDKGDQVKRGQLLFELDARVEKANVALAKARANMRAELAAEQVNLKYDQLQQQRVGGLQSHSLVSQQNNDEAQRIEQLTRWRIEQATENRRLRRLEYERAKAQLEQTRIYARHDGVIAQRFKQDGEYVEDDPVVQLVQLNPLYAEAVLPMGYFNQVKPGMAAQLFAETDATTAYASELVRVDPMGDAASGTFGVRFALDNSQVNLPAGMKCVVRLEPGTP